MANNNKGNNKGNNKRNKEEIKEDVNLEEDVNVDEEEDEEVVEVKKKSSGLVMIRDSSPMKDLTVGGYKIKKGAKYQVNREVWEYLNENYDRDIKCI